MLAPVLAILGGVIGVSALGAGGFLVGAGLGWCLGELHRLKARILELESAVRSIAAGAEKADRAPIVRAMPGMEEMEEGLEAAENVLKPVAVGAPSNGEPPLARDVGQVGEQSGTVHGETEAATAGPTSGYAGALSRLVSEWITGGNLLVRVGVLVLFVGLAFLVRYAAEREYLPIELRLAAVGLGGAVLLGVGWRLRERRRPYALVLQGAAVAILYLTVFAAMRLYGLIPAGLAFPFLVTLGAVSGALAVLQDARALASFGIAGGFAAPILTSTGQGSHVLLFSYYAVLNLGVLGVAWYKAWRELNLIGFCSTFAIGTAWGVLTYKSHQFASTEPFLILFFGFYVAVAILFALRQPPNFRGYVDGTLVFGLPLIAFALQSALVKPYPYGLAWSAFALAAFYIGMAWVLFLRAPETLRMMAEAFLAIGVAFGTLAIPLALDNRWTAAAWAMEGAALVWVGVRQERLLARLAGVVLVLASGAAFLINMPGSHGKWPFLNGFWLGGAMVSLAGLLSAYWLDKGRVVCKRFERVLGALLGIWGLLWWYGSGAREIDVHAPRLHGEGALLLFLAFSSVSSDLVRARLNWRLLGYPAWSLTPLLVLFAADVMGRGGHPFQNGGWWGWPLALAGSGWILWRQERESAFPGREAYLHPPALWLLMWVMTWEASYRAGLWAGDVQTWAIAARGALPALCAVLLTIRGHRIRWPVARHRETYLLGANGGLCLYAWLWILFNALSSEGSPLPLPYLPVLNPLDIAAGIAFLSIFLCELHIEREIPRMKERWIAVPWSQAYPVAYGLTFFLWLNTILARTWHHWGGIAWSLNGLFRSMAFQASLSIFWSLAAFCVMVYAARRTLRRLWLAGAGLMGLTVVKLFLVDLAKTGTLGRVVSFISVGALILVVGYFSPVPPRGQEERGHR